MIYYPVLVDELLQNGSDDSLYINLWVFVPLNLFWGMCLFFTDNRWTACYVDFFLRLAYKAFGFCVVGGCSNDRSTTTPIMDRLDEEFRNLVDDVPPRMLEEDELPREPEIEVEEEEEEEKPAGGAAKASGNFDQTMESTDLPGEESAAPVGDAASDQSCISAEDDDDAGAACAQCGGAPCDALRRKMVAALVISVVVVFGSLLAICALGMAVVPDLFPKVRGRRKRGLRREGGRE